MTNNILRVSQQTNINKLPQKVASIILVLLIICIFILDNSKYKTIYYTLLPISILINYKNIPSIIKQHKTAILAIISTLLFFSISTLWSTEPDLLDKIKNSIFVLMLFISTIEVSKNINYKQITSTLFYATSIFTILLITILLFKNDFVIPTESRLNLSILINLSENNPISSGIILGAIILVAVNKIKESTTLWHLALITLVSSSALLLLILTKSRGPLIALAISLTILAILNKNKKTYVYLTFGLLLMLTFLYLSNIVEMLSSRMEQPNYRLWIWTYTIQSMENNWLFGHGLGSKAAIPLYNKDNELITTVSHAHSSAFDSLRVGGLIGISLISTMTAYLLYKPLKRNHGWLFLVLFIFGFICLSTNGKFPLIRPSIEWFGFWAPLFLWYAYSKHEAEQKHE